MMHVAMSPVLHVEGCRTGSGVVHRQMSGGLVCMSLGLSTCPLCFMPSLFCNFAGAVTLRTRVPYF